MQARSNLLRLQDSRPPISRGVRVNYVVSLASPSDYLTTAAPRSLTENRSVKAQTDQRQPFTDALRNEQDKTFLFNKILTIDTVERLALTQNANRKKSYGRLNPSALAFSDIREMRVSKSGWEEKAESQLLRRFDVVPSERRFIFSKAIAMAQGLRPLRFKKS